MSGVHCECALVMHLLAKKLVPPLPAFSYIGVSWLLTWSTNVCTASHRVMSVRVVSTHVVL